MENRRLLALVVIIAVALIIVIPVSNRGRTGRYQPWDASTYRPFNGQLDLTEQSTGPFTSTSVYTPQFTEDALDSCNDAAGKFPLYKADGSFDKCVYDPHIYDSPESASRPIGDPETLNDGGVFMQNSIATSISYNKDSDYFLLDRWKSGIEPPLEKWPTIECTGLISKIEDTGNGNVTITTSGGLVMHGRMRDDIYHSNQPTPVPQLMGRIRQTCG